MSVSRRVLTALAAIHLFTGCATYNDNQAGAKNQSAHLELRIQCVGRSFRLGDEIPIEFIIFNRGPSEYEFLDPMFDRSGRIPDFRLTAWSKDGNEVADPRADSDSMIGGGVCESHQLPAGGHITKSIPLNIWSSIDSPGQYTVKGTYAGFDSEPVASEPISITVQSRSEPEMDAYVESLQNEFTGLMGRREFGKKSDQRRRYEQEVLMKLAFTRSPKIIPFMLNHMFEPGTGFWEEEALMYYIPKSAETREAILKTATNTGLAGTMLSVLRAYHFTEPEWHALIQCSLSMDNPRAWAGGAMAAQGHPSDEFEARLIAIATLAKDDAPRYWAIRALAWNRTDESVKALKSFLNGSDRYNRDAAAEAIRDAYNRQGGYRGKRLLPDDFDEKLQERPHFPLGSP